MKEAIAWFYTIDKKLWGDKIETNPYFATLSILFVALVGACSGAGRIFYEWFDWDVATNNVAMAYLFILIIDKFFSFTQRIMDAFFDTSIRRRHSRKAAEKFVFCSS